MSSRPALVMRPDWFVLPLSCTRAPSPAEHGYDANGNMVMGTWQSSTQTLSYDYQNCLVAVVVPGRT